MDATLTILGYRPLQLYARFEPGPSSLPTPVAGRSYGGSTPVAHIIGVLFREGPEIIPTYDSF